MILVDSSAWVEYDRATGSPVDVTLARLIGEGGAVAVTEPVVMEVCAGARSPGRERELRRPMDRFPLLTFDAAADLGAAVSIYRTCRRRGVTPRGPIDCLIAAVALRHDAECLAWDRDLARLSGVVGLRLHPDSLGP